MRQPDHRQPKLVNAQLVTRCAHSVRWCGMSRSRHVNPHTPPPAAGPPPPAARGGPPSGQEGLAVITSKRKRRDKDVSVSGQPTGGRLEAAPRVGAGRCTAPVGYDVSRTYRINHGWGFRAPRAGQVLRVGTLCVLGNRSDPLGIVGPYDVPAASGPRGAAPSCGGGGDTGPQVEGRRAAQLAACDVNNGNKVVEIGQLRSSTQSLSLPNLK
jgi:hypothetical protein